MDTYLPSQDVKCYDNTRISSYKVCPRHYLIRHQLHWKPEGTALALSFGLGWHDAQDVIWKYAKKFTVDETAALAFEGFKARWTKEGLPVDISIEKLGFYEPRTPGIAYEMIHSYVETRWKMLQEADVFAIEQPFAVPIPGLPNHWYIGRLDKGVNYNAQKLILEHKSSSAYSVDNGLRTDFMDSWYMSAQVKGYQFGGGLFYGHIHAVWVDAALVHKKVHNVFKFIPVSHNFALLNEWLDGTKAWIGLISAEEDMYADVKKLLPGMFKKNEESCYGRYGACEFIDICRAVDDPTQLEGPPPGFIEEKWEPFDILGFNKLLAKEKEIG